MKNLSFDFIKKVDPIKALAIGGTVLGFVASALSKEADNKNLEATIEKKVAEKLAQKANEQ